MAVSINQSRYEALAPQWQMPCFSQLSTFFHNIKAEGKVIYPPGKQIFAAFDACAFDEVKVVIIGQDPYHGPGQANGLCFSVNNGVKTPPSLVKLPRAREEVDANGVAYIDEEGDLVTTIIDGANCAFTCYDKGGMCLCAIEKACRQGKIDFLKPASCHLYTLRLTEYAKFTAVNYHRWKICKPAEALGRKLGFRLYQFLKGPLTSRVGQEWDDELVLACETYLTEYASK